MFCTACGSENVEAARFCYSCGAEIQVPKRAAGAAAPAPRPAAEAGPRPAPGRVDAPRKKGKWRPPEVRVAVDEALPDRPKLSAVGIGQLVCGVIFSLVGTWRAGALNPFPGIGLAAIPAGLAWLLKWRGIAKDWDGFALSFLLLSIVLAVVELALR